jgi:hypothetical protein
MLTRLCLFTALLAIWALQTAIIVVSVGATAEFTLRALVRFVL